MSTTAADGIPRGVAGTSQTIDVYGSPGPIASGGFRLWYGNADGIAGSASSSTISTSCIPASAADLTDVAVADALSAMNDFIAVTVTETDQPFDDARRFVVDFSAPELGVGTLGVVAADGDCEWLQCNDGDCEESGVILNREASVAVQEGAIEVRARKESDASRCQWDVAKAKAPPTPSAPFAPRDDTYFNGHRRTTPKNYDRQAHHTLPLRLCSLFSLLHCPPETLSFRLHCSCRSSSTYRPPSSSTRLQAAPSCSCAWTPPPRTRTENGPRSTSRV